eukprot:scaffold226973_cov36-Prasinocladus_malaysianus.AAC.1
MRKWANVGSSGSRGSPSLSVTSRRGSRGAVLLSAGEDGEPPAGFWEFEAEVALLPGGHWPPRGLVSGTWPPAATQKNVPPNNSGCTRNQGSGSSSDSCFSGQRLPTDRIDPFASTLRSGGSDASLSRTASGITQPATPVAANHPAGPPQAQSWASNHSGRAERRRLKLEARRMKFTHIIHCGSVRQSAT